MPNVYIEPRPKGRPEGDPTPQGARNWVLRYMLNGRPRWMGLGPLALYSLAEARAKALDSRRKRHEGIDPIDARRAERARLRLDAANSLPLPPARGSGPPKPALAEPGQEIRFNKELAPRAECCLNNTAAKQTPFSQR
jgi:hypothetical protein